MQNEERYEPSVEEVLKLREATGKSAMECKKALRDCKGDAAKAGELLVKWQLSKFSHRRCTV